MSIRTRFAPSPTGFLHIGGARTALFSWLYARKYGGRFILRIEDTDRERSTEASVNAILESMAWLGLAYDEGPFFQSKRFDRYRAVIEQLLCEGKAYRCNCSKERLENLRAEQIRRKEKPRYNGHCRDRDRQPAAGPSVVRFKNPLAGQVVVDDLVRGKVVFENSELDDLILARTDGTPTYNLTVVVDDLEMGINYVIRGDDHLNNTPRQINILKALGAELPYYAHVPMILGPDGKRLSKRHGAVSVLQYRDEGYLPEALLNYLARLGWSYGDQEIFSLDEMIELFDIRDVNSSASTFNTSKLQWLNQQYIKNSDPEHVAHHLGWHMGQLDIDPSSGPLLKEVVNAQRERAKTLLEMARNSVFFYRDCVGYDEKAAAKHLRPEACAGLARLRECLETLASWSKEDIHQVVMGVAQAFGWELGKLAQPLRVAVSGSAVSPPIEVTLHLLGRERTLFHIDAALRYINQKGSGDEARGGE
jgi:glutamyl-tRNA synthetase, bacterial family